MQKCKNQPKTIAASKKLISLGLKVRPRSIPSSPRKVSLSLSLFFGHGRPLNLISFQFLHSLSQTLSLLSPQTLLLHPHLFSQNFHYEMSPNHCLSYPKTLLQIPDFSGLFRAVLSSSNAGHRHERRGGRCHGFASQGEDSFLRE